MQYDLGIVTILYTDAAGHHAGPLTPVKAEAELGRHSQFGWPDSFKGKLVGATLAQLLHFKSDPGVEVGFRGKRYKFAELDKDGLFTLVKGW